MQLTSSPRRALGLLAVGALGMSTAVVGVTGVAQAAPATPGAPITFTAADSPVVIPAGYCTVDWTLVGGQGGASEAGAAGAKGGELVLTTDAYEKDSFELFAGTAGSPGAAGAGGAGGINADGQNSGGLIGWTPDPAGSAGGGGGAASTVRAGGYPFLLAFGGNGAGMSTDPQESAGTGGGNGENRARGAAVTPTVTTTATGNGSVSGIIQPCVPGTPTVKWIEGGEKSATLQIWSGTIPQGATITYEYSLDNGAWKTLVTGNDFQYEPTITGLTYGTTYSVRVRATANGVSSDPTVAQPVTPRIGAPTGVKATTGPGSITLTWAPPADPVEAADVKGYAAWAIPAGQQHSGGVVDCAEMNAAARTCTIGVPTGVEYEVGVQAIGSKGYGVAAFAGTGKIGGSTISPTLPKADGALTSSATNGQVVAGAPVTMSGKGFLSGSTVDLVVYSTPVRLGTAVVLADGSFSATATLPKELANGVHNLVATGVDANGNVRNLVVEVTVSGGTAVLANSTVLASSPVLANTGFSALPYAGAGALALLAGGGLILGARRRNAA